MMMVVGQIRRLFHIFWLAVMQPVILRCATKDARLVMVGQMQ
jgi:hypothetical protein